MTSSTIAAIRAHADTVVASGTGPAGMAIGVAAGDDRQVIVSGLAQVGPLDDRALGRSTVHDLASVTKVFTTMALMRLVDSGDVNLDDPIGRYIGRFSGAHKNDITVRQLLLHRGGLCEWWPLYVATPDGADPLSTAAELPLRHRPDGGFHYSDVGFMLLGATVAAAAGTPIDHALAELVISPCGLTDTGFGPVVGDVSMSARGDDVEEQMVATGEPYPVPFAAADFGGWRRDPIVGMANDGNAFHAFGGTAGHAGLFSTIDDLLTVGQVLAGDGPTLWSAATAAAFFSPGPDAGQSLGFRRYAVTTPDTPVVLGHPGFVGCAIGFVPESGRAVAMVSNRLLGTAPPSTTTLWEDVLRVVAASEVWQQQAGVP